VTTPRALLDSLDGARPGTGGYLSGVRGLIAEARGIELPIGGMVEIEAPQGFLPAEVVGFRQDAVQLMPLVSTRGIAPGYRVWPRAASASVRAGDFLLGRVIGGTGEPIDGGPTLPPGDLAPLYREPQSPLQRPPLSEPLDTGVRGINAAATFARGQRVGLFSGAGVGKSTLLGMLARGTDADVTVVGLIGERGREVREFIEGDLAATRRRSIVVAVPSDAAPLLRARGAYVATAISEHFRDRGKNVLLLMDSVTRFAMAMREIGLARGEPATTKGYTPSVFAELPKLLERAGRSDKGSITGIYTVLVEGDDMEDPIADSLRAILDGHIVLSREIAERGQYPAIDVLASVSRAMPAVVSAEHRDLATRMRRLLAAYRDAQDLIQVGAYAQGSDPDVDEAIVRRPAIEAMLRQDMGAASRLTDDLAALEAAMEGVAA